tara:strand:- start:46140 stop:46502 length:363 start_codon:yes stop_codon:yes gene_type:complete
MRFLNSVNKLPPSDSDSFLRAKLPVKANQQMKWRLTEHALPSYLGAILFIASLFMTGCGQGPPQKEIRVETPVGKPGLCENCKQKIPNVAPENLMTFNAIQYVVCNEKCASELQEKLARQ